MSPAARVAAAFRRIGAITGALLVRGDDAKRMERHGVSIPELNERTVAFAEKMEKSAFKRDTLL